MKPTLAVLLSALLPWVAQAQMPVSSPTSTRSSTTVAPPPVPAQPVPAPSNAPRPLPSPVQPVQPAQPIKATGPAPLQPTAAPKRADKVYDRNGRLLPGVRPAGPNRVFDSRTGRYYDSVPTVDGQQIR